MTYCKGKECRKHTQHKVTQYKAGKVCPTTLTRDDRILATHSRHTIRTVH